MDGFGFKGVGGYLIGLVVVVLVVRWVLVAFLVWRVVVSVLRWIVVVDPFWFEGCILY